MFNDLIDIMLQKKADLRAEVEREFAERSDKIDKMLDMCGYVEPVEVEKAEEEAEAPASVECVAEGENGTAIY